MVYNEDIYFGRLLRGDLRGAMDYLAQFPECAELSRRYQARFAEGQVVEYPIDPHLNHILTLYQKYYRSLFYGGISPDEAACALQKGLSACLKVEDMDLAELEQRVLPEMFRARGCAFLGGKTGGFYGPYVWTITETATYQVELPDGVQPYTVKLMDGFITKGWLDYLSFGRISAGGWADKDGVIHCIKSLYNTDSENFQVSLLKHEAQHARDLAEDPDMSSADLEYRAKLVELMYSQERNLLEQFALEADPSDPANGHTAAADRIVREMGELLGAAKDQLGALPRKQVQAAAGTLFRRSRTQT